MVKTVGRIVARGMLRENTPLEYHPDYGLWVKREDKACPAPGPPFSKARGVYAHLLKRPETLIGVLDTYHSQAGHAVARACQVLGKRCVNYYPEFKNDPGYRDPQERARSLGAELVGLPAGRSAILYHGARKDLLRRGREREEATYLMPNALKLPESVEETAREVPCSPLFDYVLIPASSGTIAAGVIRGFAKATAPWDRQPTYLVHLGYSRSHTEVLRYIRESSGVSSAAVELIDEGYAYKDTARPGPTPPWPCNAYYDLKAFRWWVREGRIKCLSAGGTRTVRAPVLLWNIG